MTNDHSWFAEVEGTTLKQGDMFLSCPIYPPAGDGTIHGDTADVVVMSQSCDLAHDKLELIQVCPY